MCGTSYCIGLTCFTFAARRNRKYCMNCCGSQPMSKSLPCTEGHFPNFGDKKGAVLLCMYCSSLQWSRINRPKCTEEAVTDSKRKSKVYLPRYPFHLYSCRVSVAETTQKTLTKVFEKRPCPVDHISTRIHEPPSCTAGQLYPVFLAEAVVPNKRSPLLVGSGHAVRYCQDTAEVACSTSIRIMRQNKMGFAS